MNEGQKKKLQIHLCYPVVNILLFLSSKASTLYTMLCTILFLAFTQNQLYVLSMIS